MAHPLDQSDFWTNRDGLPIQVSTMSERYALNAYRLMERNAIEIAFKYSVYLGTVSMPDADTVAFDAVEAGINREIDQMQTNVLNWLRDKPLMKALLARISEHAASVDVVIEAILLPETAPYSLPPFNQAKPAPVISADVRKPGDEGTVFLVSAGVAEDYEVLAAFVGNRRAALQFAAEYNRYARYVEAVVEEVPDGSIAGGDAREYPTPFTRITYRTEIDLETGEVVSNWQPATAIRTGAVPSIETKKEPVTRRHYGNGVVITTIGPEHQLMDVKRAHREAVVMTRASILETDQIFNEGEK